MDDNRNDSKPKQRARDTEDFIPIGGLYDDPRDHGSATTQRADEGSKPRDDAGNKRADNLDDTQDDNAAGSPTRGNSSKDNLAAGHGNG